MMVFTESAKPAKQRGKRSRKPKRWVIIAVFVVLVGLTWWVSHPRTSGPSSPSVSDGAGTISGTLTGSDGQLVTTAEIKVADSQGNLVNSLAVNQDGQFQLFLPHGVYIFSISAKGEQLIQQVRVDQNSPKTVDLRLNVPGGP